MLFRLNTYYVSIAKSSAVTVLPASENRVLSALHRGLSVTCGLWAKLLGVGLCGVVRVALENQMKKIMKFAFYFCL